MHTLKPALLHGVLRHGKRPSRTRSPTLPLVRYELSRRASAVYPLDDMRALSRFAREEIGTRVYVDGARIFNASVATASPGASTPRPRT